MQSPIVLHEERGVVVAQMNLVVSRRESAGVGEEIGSGGGGTESLEVVGRREQLILLEPRVEAVDHRAQEVHADLQIVAADELVDVGVERRVLLIEKGRGSKIAEGHGREIPENEAGRGGAPRVVGIEERRPCEVRLGRHRLAVFASERAAQRQDIGVRRIAQQRRVAERQQQPAGVGIIARRGQTRCRGQRQEVALSSLSV